jgi:N-methylhydantoinase A/oxoprolinase/acetone carboxylase beta subunit
MAILGVDVGGTFTDAVVVDGGAVRTAKVLTSERQ